MRKGNQPLEEIILSSDKIQQVQIMFTFCIAIKRADYIYKYNNYDEDSGDYSDSFISLKGEVMRQFALISAIDNQGKNMICSPVSAVMPLGKLAIGAEDPALAELLKAIGVSGKSKLKYHYMLLLEDLKYLPGVQLDIASRFFVSINTNLQRHFVNQATNIFNSSAEKVDFTTPSKVASAINNWVSMKTNGMIKELLSPSEISSDSSLVLVNAIYFSGLWNVPFKSIPPGVFYTPTGERKVPMMSRYGWLKYKKSKVLGAQLVEVPYAGNESSFVILLPSKRNGLPALLSQLKLAPELLDSEFSKMAMNKVMLTMPKFKMESKLDLRNLYRKIGLNDIFNPHGSGLSGIVQDQSVFVSSANHKAVIEVSEQGTDAAASSVVQVIGVSVNVHRERIDCYHPFLFFVKMGMQQLFAGILNYP